MYKHWIDSANLPFAFPVHLMLRERDVLVVNVDPKAERDLPQILITLSLFKGQSWFLTRATQQRLCLGLSLVPP